MEEIRKALLNIRDSIETLAKHCDDVRCSDCALKNNVCSNLNFESVSDSISEWLRESEV